MMMSEVEIAGQHYLIGKLDARQQFKVVKRLAPVIQGLLPIWQVLQQSDRSEVDPVVLGLHAVTALSNTINMLNDDDSDYVIDMCLGVVKFQSPGGGWAPLRAGNGTSRVMFEPADNLAVQMRLLWEVLYENLRNFSLETLLPTALTGSLPAGLPSFN